MTDRFPDRSSGPGMGSAAVVVAVPNPTAFIRQGGTDLRLSPGLAQVWHGRAFTCHQCRVYPEARPSRSVHSGCPGRDGKPGAADGKPAHPQDRPSLRGSRLTPADQMWHAVTVAQRAVVRI